jgi:cobalt-zinc-cadmium efflux system membrane fusion protein
MQFDKRVAAGASALLLLGAAVYLRSGALGGTAPEIQPPPRAAPPVQAAVALSLDLTEKQLASVKVEPATERFFPLEKEAFGNIDFDEDMAVQVFAPYQGRIIEAFAKLGDDVERGQTLFTIESPDLIQAESTLIAAAGVLDLTTKTLVRAKELYAKQGLAQKDLEQAVSDQQTAEGALKAARDAVRIFGKTEAEMDRMIAQRRIDRALVVTSPISGRVTARNAQPGLLVQPGNTPAPYTVADLSSVWMIANVAEIDSSLFLVGQEEKVRVLAYPDRVFEGRVTRIATAVDPNIHRLVLRSEVADPQHALRPGMFASFTIRTAAPVKGIAVPLDGVVREGDGTMTLWVTTDRRHFVRRTVTLGLQKEGYDQIVEGLRPGELIATTGAVFLSNMLNGGPT